MPWQTVVGADGNVLPFSPGLWKTFADIYPWLFGAAVAAPYSPISAVGQQGNDIGQLIQRALSVITFRGQYRQRFMLPFNASASPSAEEVGSFTVKSRADWARTTLAAATDLTSIFGWPNSTDEPVNRAADLVDDLPLRMLLHLARLAGRHVNAVLWIFAEDGTIGNPRMITMVEREWSDQYLPLRLREDESEVKLELDPESADGQVTMAQQGAPIEWLVFGRNAGTRSPLYMYRPPTHPVLSLLTLDEVKTANSEFVADGAEPDLFATAPHPLTRLPIETYGNTNIQQVMNVVARPTPPGFQAYDRNAADLATFLGSAAEAWRQTGRGNSADMLPQLQEMLVSGGQSTARVAVSEVEARRYAEGIMLVVRLLRNSLQNEVFVTSHRLEERGFQPLPEDVVAATVEEEAAIYGEHLWRAIESYAYPADDTLPFLLSLASSWGGFTEPLRYVLVHPNWFVNLVPELEQFLNAPDLPGAFDPAATIWIRRLPGNLWSEPLIFNRYNAPDANAWLFEFFKHAPAHSAIAIKTMEFQRPRHREPAKLAYKKREFQRRTGALRIVPPGPPSALGGGGVQGPAGGPEEGPPARRRRTSPPLGGGGGAASPGPRRRQSAAEFSPVFSPAFSPPSFASFGGGSQEAKEFGSPASFGGGGGLSSSGQPVSAASAAQAAAQAAAVAELAGGGNLSPFPRRRRSTGRVASPGGIAPAFSALPGGGGRRGSFDF